MKPSSGKSDESKSKSCENIQQYLLSSSLHGLRYIGTTTLSAFERIFFGISFLMVFCLAAYFISNVWQKWKETPIIIGLDPSATNIKDIPFPAVTICNMNQVKKSFAKSLTAQRDKIILESICTQGDSINDEDENIEGKWTYVREFLLNASQSCDDMIQLCKFGMQRINCDESFKSVLTDEGLCCTFNAVHPKLMFNDFDQLEEDMTGEIEYSTWSPEGGYQVDTVNGKKPYPVPVPGPGSHMGLTLIINADVSNYYCSSTSSSGFKVLLHSPIETPKIANYGFFVGTGMETKVVISPKISEASDLIRKVPIQQRQCIFANEANLSYYKIYSKNNCEMECSSKTTEEACGCTLYYMPRKFTNGSKICNRKKANCYEKVLYNIASSMVEEYSCNYCLPACFEINYGREISSSKLGTGDFITAEAIKKRGDAHYIRDNLAIIHIFFIDNAYGGFTKSELIGFTEFLSNTGGLLGLFMGFSVISLIEIIYFLSLRPYCAQKRLELRRQIADERIEFHNRIYNNALRGANKTTMVGQSSVNDYYMQSEMFHKRRFCRDFYRGIISGWRFIKAKLMSCWKRIVEIHDNMRGGGEGRQQHPFPYYE